MPGPDSQKFQQAQQRMNVLGRFGFAIGVVLGTVAGRAALAEQEVFDKEERRANESTVAQANETMGRYTRRLFYLTGASVLTSVLTAFLFYKQIVDSRENQRAFVSISISEHPEFSQLEGPENKPRVSIWHFLPNWTNNGNTATKNMIARVGVYNFCGPIPDQWEFPDIVHDTKDLTAMPMDLAPKATEPGEPLELQQQTSISPNMAPATLHISIYISSGGPLTMTHTPARFMSFVSQREFSSLGT